MIVTFHQPNYIPGASVITKVLASDAIVWMDTVQFTKGGYTNRNRLPDGRWITVPVAGEAFAPINRVRIGNPAKEWRGPMIAAITEAWPGVLADAVCLEISRGYPLLVGLNASIIRILLDVLDYEGEQHWQSHLDSQHALPANSDEPETLKPISLRIAEMVYALGGTVYLSGPSGRRYLDEGPFLEREITVEYWHHEGSNPCSLALASSQV